LGGGNGWVTRCATGAGGTAAAPEKHPQTRHFYNTDVNTYNTLLPAPGAGGGKREQTPNADGSKLPSRLEAYKQYASGTRAAHPPGATASNPPLPDFFVTRKIAV
jgi:hypothetical protein